MEFCVYGAAVLYAIGMPTPIGLLLKQAENGLQSRSSENGKTAVWHYGMKLQ